MKIYYFYLNGKNEQEGPIGTDEFNARGITKETYVWREGMAEWTKAGSLKELAHLWANSFNNSSVNTCSISQNNNDVAQNKGEKATASFAPPMPSNNLVWGILVTLFCCLPFGIVSIVKAASVDSLYLRGQYEEAYAKSREAKNWALYGLIVYIVFYLLLFIIFITMFHSLSNLYQQHAPEFRAY